MRPEDQLTTPPPYSSEYPSRIVRLRKVTLPAVGWISNSRSIPLTTGSAPGSGKPASITVAPPVSPDPAPWMVIDEWMSKSPVPSRSSFSVGISISYTPAGNTMVSCPGNELASLMAALNEHDPSLASQLPLPGLASARSTKLSTVRVVAASAGGESTVTRVETMAATRRTRVNRRVGRRRRGRGTCLTLSTIPGGNACWLPTPYALPPHCATDWCGCVGRSMRSARQGAIRT